jgi:hypothetical protein
MLELAGGKADKPMQAIVLRSHVREDGSVDVRVPSEYAGKDVELVVVVQSLTGAAPKQVARPYDSLRLMASMNLDGPVDGAERFHEILYRLPDDDSE